MTEVQAMNHSDNTSHDLNERTDSRPVVHQQNIAGHETWDTASSKKNELIIAPDKRASVALGSFADVSQSFVSALAKINDWDSAFRQQLQSITESLSVVQKPVIAPLVTLDKLVAKSVFNEIKSAYDVAQSMAPYIRDLQKTYQPIALELSRAMQQSRVLQSDVLSKFSDSALAEIRKHNESVVASLASVIDTSRFIQEQFAGFTRTFQLVGVNLAAKVAEISGPFVQFAEMVHREREAVDACMQVGICVAPSMDKQLLERIRNLKREGKRKRIAQVISRYYKARDYSRLKAMVSSWDSNPLFVPRMRIIRDGVQAHLNKQYTLSIPTLLPQVEGIAGDFVLHSELPVAMGKKQVIIEAFNEASIDWASFAVFEGVIEYVDNLLYQSKDFKKLKIRSKERLNRHVILHGRQVNYANELNSLRVLLLLDAMSILRLDAELPKKQRSSKRKITGQQRKPARK